MELKVIFLTVVFVSLMLFFVDAVPTELKSPEKYLRPRNYNPHPYANKNAASSGDASEAGSRHVQQFAGRQGDGSGRTGPVLFPKNTPTPTNNPLIVTSRPLAEQIARQNHKAAILTPSPPTYEDQNLQQISANEDPNSNNNLYSQNYLNQDGYFQQISEQNLPEAYANQNGEVDNQGLHQFPNPIYVIPKGYNVVDSYGNVRVLDYNSIQILQKNGYLRQAGYEVNNTSLLGQHPYAAAVKKSQQDTSDTNAQYDAAEQQTVAPPNYRAVRKYTKSKVPSTGQRGKPPLPWGQSAHETNTVENLGGDDEYYNDDSSNGPNKHYAFSYAVKDRQTGDDFSHSQRKTGTGTNGEYRVKLPDGRTQIVSYTADNGGYKADVRYQDDKDAVSSTQRDPTIPARYPLQYQQPIAPNRLQSKPIYEQTKLGRIVVPSQEETDYQDTYYDNEQNNAKTEQPYINYVTNDAKEVLITSRPGYLYSTSSTPSNLLYNFNNNYDNGNRYTVTPRPLVYVQPTNDLLQGRPFQNGYSSTTNNPQDASRTYSHYYNAESVKFVSTTPKYPPILRNSINEGSSRYTSTTPATNGQYNIVGVQNEAYYPVSSTPSPGLDSYDHLDTPEVVKIEPRPKPTVRYTSLAPLYSSVDVSQNAVTPTALYKNGQPTQSVLNIARYLGRGDAIDLRKYFAYQKR